MSFACAAEEVTRWSPHTTPTFCKDHELEYDPSPQSKEISYYKSEGEGQEMAKHPQQEEA